MLLASDTEEVWFSAIQVEEFMPPQEKLILSSLAVGKASLCTK
jgi:hypothetical protein